MESQTLSCILKSLVYILVITGVIKAVNWVWLRPKKWERWLRKQGIPGTSYRLLFGDLKDLFSMQNAAKEKPMTSFTNDYFSRVEPLRHQTMTKFGKDYFMWLGPIPFVNISNPHLVREAFTKIQEFQKPKLNPIFDKLFPGLVSYEGDKWAKHRKIINPAFHMEKLKHMLPAMYDSCSEMINKWEMMIIAETGCSELDVCPYLTTLTADVISRAAFGSCYEDGRRIFELIMEQTDLTLRMLETIYIPGMMHIPTAKNRRFKEVERLIQTLLKGVIDKRKKTIEAGGEAGKVDLLGILVESNLRAARDNNHPKHELSLQEVIEECKLFYLAGQETTAILLVWTMILLSKHQDWQARAREEVFQTFGQNVPDFEGLNHLKIVTMILYEVLRLYPPVTGLARRIKKDTKLGEFSLPAGAMIALPMLEIQQDKDVWGDDSKEFKPDRFSEGISKAIKGNVSTFFAFGWGPRVCIGEKFALTEVKMALSMVLQRFSFELSPFYVHAPVNVIFLRPQHGAQIILRHL